MRTLAVLLLLAPLSVVGCGIGASQSGTRDGGPSVDSGPLPTEDGGGCVVTEGPGGNPRQDCTDCNGNPVPAVCENGVYQCPSYGCPLPPPPECAGTPPSCGADCNGNPLNAVCSSGGWSCPVVGGCNGCGDTPIACPITTGEPCAPYWTPECLDNTWTCVELFPECPDASPVDASVDASPDDASIDAPVPPPFACGTVGCDPATTYCQITTGGPVAEDGGGSGYFYCPPLPSSCAPGAPATCACVQADEGIGCGCVESGGEVTITCVIQ